MAASALAAVSAALISSTFGVAGTLIGTAIASVMASVGSTLYLASLRRTNDHLRRVAVAARRTDWSNALATRPSRASRAPVAEMEPSPEPREPSGWNRLRWSNLRTGLPTVRRRWVAVGGLCVVIFVVAIAALTAIQASTSQRLTAFPASSGSGHTPLPAPSVTPTPATSPTPTASLSPTPTPSTSPSASVTATAAPSSPSGATPSATPSPSVGATVAPSPSPATLP